MKTLTAIASIFLATLSFAEGTKTLSKAETDKLVFGQIIKENLLKDRAGIGRLVILDQATRYYQAASERGDNINESNLQAYVNATTRDYNDRVALIGENGSASNLTFVNLALTAIATMTGPGGAASAMLSSVLALNVAESMYRDYGKYRESMEIQNEAITTLNHADRISHAAWDLGLKNETFANAINKTIGLDAKAQIGTDARLNLERNPILEDRRKIGKIYDHSVALRGMLARNIASNGELGVSVTQIKNMTQAFQTELINEVRQSKTDLLHYLEEKDKAETTKLAEAETKRLRYETANSTLYLTSTLMGSIDPKAAKSVIASGSGLIQLCQAFEKFKNAQKLGQDLIGMINLAANITSVVSSVLSFMATQPTIDQMILEQVQELRKQVSELREEMHTRFDNVDRNINRLFTAMMTGFDAIQKKLGGIEVDVIEVKRSIGYLHQHLNHLDGTLNVYLRDGFNMPNIEKVEDCLQDNRLLELEELRSCLSSMRTFATTHASNSLSAGATEAILSGNGQIRHQDDALFPILRGEFARGVWPKINLFTVLSEKRFYHPVNASGLPAFVNPEIWSEQVGNYFTLISRYPSLVKHLHGSVVSDVNKMLQVGDSLSSALKNIGIARTTLNTSPISDALSVYHGISEQLKIVIATSKRSYEQNKLNGYQLDKDAEHQADADTFYRESIGPCAGFVIPRENGDKNIPTVGAVAGEWKTVIPNQFRIAERQGLGRINICYDEVEWTNVGVVAQNPTEDHHLGNIYLVMRLSYQDPSGDKVFSRRKIVGNIPVHFAVQAWKFVQNWTKPAPNIERVPAWGNGNWGVPSDQSLLRNTLISQWNGSDGLASRFMNQSTEVQNDPSVAAEAIRSVNEHLAAHRTRFNSELTEGIKNNGLLGNSLQAMEGARKTLEGLLYLAFPDSLSTTDGLRQFFNGEKALANEESISKALEFSGSGIIDPSVLLSQNGEQVERFQKIISDLIQNRNGKESHGVIQETLQRLELLRKIERQLVHQRPIHEAIEQVRLVVDAF